MLIKWSILFTCHIERIIINIYNKYILLVFLNPKEYPGPVIFK